jgi:ComF family protein
MHCPICAIPTSTPDICGRCLKRQPRFDSVCAALLYAFPVDRIIQLLKFSGNLRVAKLLSAELMRVVDSESRPDILIPMPLSKERLRERGFNQAIEIARALSVALRVPLELDACVRQVHTAPQMGLPLAERRSNIRNAFRCDRALRGARIAVVDDVLTSGTTLDELARTLKRAGASQVTGWIAARTPERP